MSSLDIDKIGLQGSFVRPTDSAYDTSIARGSDLAVLRPAYVAYPATFEDVPKLIKFARTHNPPLELSVKSGGSHTSTGNSSDGGLVIDLAKLNRVSLEGVDGDRKIRAQAGALTGDVYAEAGKHELDVVLASVWSVGIGGFLTGGGHSNLSGIHGLGVDNILEITVALADGTIVKATETSESDLFWTIRGGTGQFGIALEFVLKAHPTAGAAVVGALVYSGTELEKVLDAAQKALSKLAPGDRLIVSFQRAPPHFYPGIVVIPLILGTSEHADDILSPFRTTDLTPIVDMIHRAPDQLTASHGIDKAMENAPRRVSIRGALIPDPSKGVDKKLLLEMWKQWAGFTDAHEDLRESMILWEYQPVGITAERGDNDSAVGYRSTASFASLQGRNRTPASDELSKKWTRDIAAFVRSWHGPALGSPPNFAQGDEPLEEIFGPNIVPRLRKLKAKYDPDQVWRRGIRIEPDFIK